MKISEFKLNRLDDFAGQREREADTDPFTNTPFGISRDGGWINTWQTVFNRIGVFYRTAGKNFFGSDDLTLVTVLSTETGLHPLDDDQPFGWDGKINEYAAGMAVCRAFELLSDNEISEFLRINKPSVVFSYMDSDGPGEITVKYDGSVWLIAG